ncbi:MAG: response regulator [Ignavibacteriaceae bacterium]
MNDTRENTNQLKPKLLYVEDDKVATDLVTRLLKNKYDIESAKSGDEALKMAEENDYDAFLMDIGLPGKYNGIQTTKELGKIKNNKNKPFIAITAYAMEGDREYFLSEGLTHYISKPFEFVKFIKLIDEALKKPKEPDE